MKYASVCSGVEAASLAWMPLGWEAAWFSEIEPFPCEVLKQRFPGVPNLGDMTKIKTENLENGDQKFTSGDGTVVLVPGGVDLLVGGTPCQSFSVAGKREGLDGASGLARTFVQLLESMQPRWFVWENVPGCLSSRNKQTGVFDFNFLLAAFAEVGYTCGWRILDAQYVRVDGYPRAIPQRRRRLFTIGHLGADWKYPAEVLFEPSCLCRNTPPKRIKAKNLTSDAQRCLGTASTLRMRAGCEGGGKGALVSNELSLTLAAGSNDQTLFTADRCISLVPYGTRLGAHENGIASTIARIDAKFPQCVCTADRPWDESGVNPTLNQCGAANGTPGSSNQELFSQNFNGLVQEVLCRATQQGNAETMSNVCPTITEAAGTSGNNQPIITTAISIGNGQLAEASIASEECCQTLNCMHDAQAVLCLNDQGGSVMQVENDGNAGTLRANTHGNEQIVCEAAIYDSRENGNGGISPTLTGDHLNRVTDYTPIIKEQKGFYPNQFAHFNQTAVAIAENIIGRQVQNGWNGTGAQEELAYTQNASGVMGVANSATVRRLLPIECERLMGFPEVDVLEIGKMTKDEFIAWELAQGNISVDIHSGKVFSHRTGGGNPCEPHELEGTILNGYKVVSLREKDVKKQCRVHRIVWIAAHGIIPENMTVDHINNNKQDNRIENLQLLTAVDNSKKAHADGLIPHHKKVSEETIQAIITLNKEHNIPIRRLVEYYGISKSRFYQLVKSHGWTQVPWKGKPAEECPDSPRYKACGNSMCVNVMRWLGLRIELVERRTQK